MARVPRAGVSPQQHAGLQGSARARWSAAAHDTAAVSRPPESEPVSAGRVWSAARERGRAWVPLVILVGGLVLLLYSMQLGGVTTSGYDLQRLQAERNEWRQRNEQLELELAKVQSIAWIEVEAVRRLGMQKAGRVAYLEVVPPSFADQPREPPLVGNEVAPPRQAEGFDILAIWRGILAHVVPPLDAGP
jgi:hypothetical protein